MSKPDLVKILQQEDWKPEQIHGERLSEERFKDMMYCCVASHYKKHHPEIEMTDAITYVKDMFVDVAHQMWQSYQQNHHTLREYITMLKDIPCG